MSQFLNQLALGAAALGSGLFASKPAAATGNKGNLYFATDLGSTGILLISTGSKWKPVNGSAVLVNDPTLHTAAATGSEKNAVVYTIPAGLLSATGTLRIWAQGNHTGTLGTKTFSVRHSATSGDVSGGNQLMNSSVGSNASFLSGNFQCCVSNTAANAQIFLAEQNGYVGNGSNSALSTGSVNTANASYLNFNITGTVTDTPGYQGIMVEWLEN